jgi:signal transduction histidine kinase
MRAGRPRHSAAGLRLITSVADDVARAPVTEIGPPDGVPRQPTFPRVHSPRPQAPRRHRLGSAARLAAFHALILIVVLGAVVALLIRQFATSYQTLGARALASELRVYSAEASAAGRPGNLENFTVGFLQTRALPSGTVLVVGLAGNRIIATPGATALLKDPRVSAWLANPPAAAWSREVSVSGAPTEVLVAPLLVNGVRTGTFLAASDLTLDVAQRSRVLTLSLAEAGIALLAGVASAYLLLRRLLRTVGRITTTAEQIGSGALDRRLGDQGIDDEVGQLASTFDSMLERIDSAMTAQRRLLSDVSHQLRTPLTVARGHLEVLHHTGDIADPAAVTETVVLVLDELDHMRSLVERLLLLGRAMEPDFLAPDLIDARAFLADLYTACQVLARRQWVLTAIPDVVVCADAPKLRGALLNLIDNAVRVTGPEDTIKLGCILDLDGGSFIVSVEDSGPGIPKAQREAVLARFARPGARDEDGTGLGLAIVRAVAEAHGGRVEVGESTLGGARIAIVLPAELVRSVEEA